ncbi:MAG TPA: hypothetical protein VK958_09225 [Methylophilus sp.]|uniref:iron chaperone n=1 Tax=Methylophilus sp. TaxID=29541 RepID=UPI002BC2247B|nr:hypothetical protein [Methylophilus sp.]HSH87414.1 hypothetical protein [Methylophilus sp.]
MAFSTHEDYFASLAPDVKATMVSIQHRVQTLLPEATPCIHYNIPAFRAKRVFFYFAAFKKHIGIYPPVSEDQELITVLAPYRGEKGNLSFPLDQPLPLDLIGLVAVALHREYEAAAPHQ